jgi:DNA-directed RNA polymerase subunit M/transcription elongation factor TFIIS
LLSLNYANGDPIIDPEHLDILMEIIGMIRSEGFEQAVQFLDGAEDPNFILWEQPSMEEGHNALARELELQQTEEKGIKGIGKCRFCPSTELIVKQAQTRSGDEGMTVFTRCVMCQKQWKN